MGVAHGPASFRPYRGAFDARPQTGRNTWRSWPLTWQMISRHDSPQTPYFVIRSF